ncbi:MAG: c-type cytochrome [Alphaproteobacteria bacterium]
MTGGRARPWLALLACLPGGCAGVQSALDPRGVEAERIWLLFWIATAFLGVVLVLTGAATLLSIAGTARIRRVLAADRFIVGAGLVVPVVSLTALLAGSLALMAERPVSAGGPFQVRVVGEQWWWRVVYRLPDGTEFESANELRIPVGRPVALTLESADVIHSFWVPNLAGKVDMIPGRRNPLTLHATKPGVSRGQCAEYCGGAHALMSFQVVALEARDFDAWLAAERAPATVDDGRSDRDQDAGAALFRRLGCGACHRIRGMATARGRIGPDLTHVGSRLSLGAATLPNDEAAIARWIVDNQHIKPGNRMPPYRIVEGDELARLAGFLAGLK